MAKRVNPSKQVSDREATDAGASIPGPTMQQESSWDYKMAQARTQDEFRRPAKIRKMRREQARDFIRKNPTTSI